MPVVYFNCPDGITRPISECLEKCPRPEGRCLSLPTLHELSFSREWKGKASTTQLLNPTRMEYLKLTQEYAITPMKRAYALLGTQHHHRLEVIAKRIAELESEKKVEDLTNTGTLDLLEPDSNGNWILTDYKTWGSYAVLMILDKDSYERYNASLQLNDYRLKVETLGFPVSQMRWQITVRDGNTWIAKKRNIEDEIMLIDGDWIDDDVVTDFFFRKNEALMKALDKKELPELCDYNERWKGRRCKRSLCEVHMFCPEGCQINKLEYKEV